MNEKQLGTFERTLATKAPKAKASGDIHLVRVKFDYPATLSAEKLADGKCMLCGENMFTSIAEGYNAPYHRCSCTCPNYGVKCPVPDSEQKCWPVSYLHMNHFFMYKMWMEPALADVDFFLRVDADLYLLRELPFDPFARMNKEGCKMATGSVGAEAPGCYEGQYDETLKWAKANKDRFPGEVFMENLLDQDARPNAVYWGGFHAGDARMYRQKAHLAYAKHITEHGGVYTHRWSDQLHFPMVTRMLTKGYKEGFESSDSKGVCLFPFFRPSAKEFKHEHRGSENAAFWKKCTA